MTKRELSQDDTLFTKKVSESIEKVDNHYQIDLPFKGENISFGKQLPPSFFTVTALTKEKWYIGKKSVTSTDSLCLTYLTKGMQKWCHNPNLIEKDRKRILYTTFWCFTILKKDKIRIVFDCNAKFRGLSLNDWLLQGPNLTNSFVQVLLRFRHYHVAVMADIESMFYRV